MPFAFYLENMAQSLAFLFYISFAAELMNFRQNDTYSYRVVGGIRWLLLSEVFLDTFLQIIDFDYEVRYTIYTYNRYLFGLASIVVIIRILRQRNPVYSYFVIGSFFFALGSMFALAKVFFPGFFGLEPNRPFAISLTYMQIGVIAEVLCFTLGMSLRNRQIELEKIEYQSQLIDQLQENERKQSKLNSLRDEIALDLHDEIGSQLSSISILSQTTSRYVVDAKVQDRLQTISQSARQVMDSMREIVWSLNSSSDSIQHIGLRIQETAFSLFGDSAVQLYFECDQSDELTGLSHKQRRELYLIAKECLTNIVRHAQAKHVWIHLQTTSEGLILCLKDDGKGFSTNARTSGIGLQSIHQRAHQLGASLTINTTDGQGTTVLVRLQFNELPILNPMASY